MRWGILKSHLNKACLLRILNCDVIETIFAPGSGVILEEASEIRNFHPIDLKGFLQELQDRHLIPAPVDWSSVRAWLYKHLGTTS